MWVVNRRRAEHPSADERMKKNETIFIYLDYAAKKKKKKKAI